MVLQKPQEQGSGAMREVSQCFLAQFQVLSSDPISLSYASIILAAEDPHGFAYPFGYWLYIVRSM